MKCLAIRKGKKDLAVKVKEYLRIDKKRCMF